MHTNRAGIGETGTDSLLLFFLPGCILKIILQVIIASYSK